MDNTTKEVAIGDAAMKMQIKEMEALLITTINF